MSRSAGAPRHDVVVVGAGLAGLACAYRLQQAGCSVLVMEAADRVGGRVRTATVGGTPVDVGAGFMTAFHRSTLRLVAELGLQEDLVQLRPRTAILHGGRLVALTPLALLPSGGLQLPPRALLGLLTVALTALPHWQELDTGDAPRAYRLDDRTVEDWSPQLSPELVDRLIDPALRCFLYTRAEFTSRALLVLLARAALGLRQLLTLRRGLGSLTAALAAGLPVSLGTEVRRARRSAEGWSLEARREEGDVTLGCERLVLAVPGDVAGTLLDEDLPAVGSALRAVPYRSARTTVVSTTGAAPGSYGAIVVPPAASECLALVSSMSALHPGLVPAHHDVTLLYGTDAPHSPDESGRDPLVQEARRLLPRYLPGPHDELLSTRWPRAVPELRVGVMSRLRRCDHDALARLGLALAGDYLNGPSMEGAVRSGESAARRLRGRIGR
jgi:oxygen-dependent protoporphyrinogen oxidase